METVRKGIHLIRMSLPTKTRMNAEAFEFLLAEQKRVNPEYAYKTRAHLLSFCEKNPIPLGVPHDQMLTEIRNGTVIGRSLAARYEKGMQVLDKLANFHFAPKTGKRALMSRKIAEAIQVLIVVDGGWGDLVTNFSAYFRHRDVAEYYRSLGFKVIELQGKDANRLQFTSALAATEPTRYVGHCGHGEAERTAGTNNEILLDPSNFSDTQGRVCVWNTCTFGKSADKRLGLGELAEVSYQDLLWINVENQQDPSKDTASPKYFECMHIVERRIAEDALLDQACYDQIVLYNDWIAKAPPIDRYYLAANLGAIIQKIREASIWKWHIGSGGGTKPKLVFSVDGVPTHEWDYVAGQTYTHQISIVQAGDHELSVRRPDGKGDKVTIKIVGEETEVRILEPQDNQEFKTGETINIKIVG